MPLFVRVVEAWHPHLGKGRCYCAVDVSGQRRRTVDVSRTTRPFFDETFRFDAVASEPSGVRVVVKLQRRYIFSDECMGAVDIAYTPSTGADAVAVAGTDTSSAGWRQLRPYRSQRRSAGQVRVLLSSSPSVSAHPVDVGGPVPLLGIAGAEAEARRASEGRPKPASRTSGAKPKCISSAETARQRCCFARPCTTTRWSWRSF